MEQPRLPFSRRLLPVLLFGLSFTLLAYEVALLRILSWLQWYHFAYLIISLALLGFGTSGTLRHLFRAFWDRHPGESLAGALLLTGLTLAAVRPLLAVIPMDTFLAVWAPGRLAGLALLCLVLFLPFLCGAFGLILVFSLVPGRIGLYYGANLLGSGAGALGAVLLLYRLHPLNIPAWLGIAAAVPGVFLAASLLRGASSGVTKRRSRVLFQVVSIGVLAATLLLASGLPRRPVMSSYKALSRVLLTPRTEVVLEQPGPLGVLTVVRGPTLRSAMGLSFAYRGEIRPRPLVFLDGETRGPLPLPDDTSAASPMRHATFALPYHVRPFRPGRVVSRGVLVPNAGTGTEVVQALMHGADAVTAVERDPRMVTSLILLGEAGKVPESAYRLPGVNAIIAEPRTFLYRDTTRYDVILLPSFSGAVSAAAGMEVVHEDYLLTIEGITALLDRLSPEGILCASIFLDTPARRPVKLFGLLAAALEERLSHEPAGAIAGLQGAGGRLAAIRSWDLVTAVLSLRPWSHEELERIREFTRDEGFDILYLPGAAEESDQATFHHLADTTLAPAIAALAAGSSDPAKWVSPFRLSPPTDNRPFFHHFLTRRSLPVMRQALGREGLLLAEWGYVLVWATLGLLALGGGLLILLPLGLSRVSRPVVSVAGPSSRLIRPVHLAYFAALGGGFMLIEILLIQKLVLVLGDPVFAVSVVIATLLVFAGAGSVLSGRLRVADQRLVTGAVVLIAVLLLVLMGLLSAALRGWAALGPVGRFVSVLLALAPLGLVMGVCFPAGVRRLEETGAGDRIPWAWGINGFTSVVAAPLATLIALDLGFTAVGVLGAGCYLLAAVLFARSGRPAKRLSV